MKKCWLATDISGSCYIFDVKPERTTINIWGSSGTYQHIPDQLCVMLIGKELNWQDEPVEINITFK